MSELKQCKDTLAVATVEAYYFYWAPQHVQLLEAAALNSLAGFSFNGGLSWCFCTKWPVSSSSSAKTSHGLRVHGENNELVSCILWQQAAAIQLRNPALALARSRYGWTYQACLKLWEEEHQATAVTTESSRTRTGNNRLQKTHSLRLPPNVERISSLRLACGDFFCIVLMYFFSLI